MDSEAQTERLDSPPSNGRFVAAQAIVCGISALLQGVAAGRVAVWTERVCAPALIFPLLVGIGLGLMFAGLMRLVQFGHRPGLLAGAVVAGLSATCGAHYFSYRDYADARAAELASKQEAAALEAFGAKLSDLTPSFAEYMRQQAERGRPVTAAHTLRGAAAWASWALDGLLLLTATVVVVYLFNRGGDKAT